MKSIVKNIIVATPLFLIMLACEKEVKFEDKYNEPKLVLNSLLEKDSIIKVDLLVSSPLIGIQNGVALNYSSTLMVLNDQTNGQSYTGVYNPDDTSFVFPVTSKENHVYDIRVSQPGYPELKSKTQIPARINITDWDTLTTEIEETSYQKLDFKWNPPVEHGYYVITAKLTGPETNNITYEYYRTVIANSEAGSTDELVLATSTEFAMFNSTDAGLGKGVTTIYLKSKPHPNTNYTVYFYHVTKELYLYLDTYRRNQDRGAFAEPIKVYNNIENGVGIFAGLTATEITF